MLLSSGKPLESTVYCKINSGEKEPKGQMSNEDGQWSDQHCSLKTFSKASLMRCDSKVLSHVHESAQVCF